MWGCAVHGCGRGGAWLPAVLKRCPPHVGDRPAPARPIKPRRILVHFMFGCVDSF
jgi:hypothetical protein